MKALRQPGGAFAMGVGFARAFRRAAMVGAAFERAAHPGVERVVARFEGEHHDRGAAVAGAGVVRLLRIEDAAVRRIEAGLRDRPDRARGGEEIGKADGAAGAKARPVLQPHPGLGDDAENAFRADEQAVGAGPGARSGQPARLDRTLGRHHAQAFDKIVDMGVEAGEMAAGAGRDPAAEGRIFEALRKMPQGQPVRLELGFERRAEGAALDARGARAAVDLDHPAKMPQIEGDRRLVAGAVDPRLDAADDAGAAAERDHRRLGAARPIDDRGDLGFAARIGDDIGRGVVVAEQAAHVVGKGLAIGMGGAVVRLGRAEARERGGRGDARRPQPDLARTPAAPLRRTGPPERAGGSGRARPPPRRRSVPRLRDPSRNI